MRLTPTLTLSSRVLSKAALCAMACLSAGTLWAKDVFLAGLSETGTNWALFDVSKNILKGYGEGETYFYDSEMCAFATSANMLAYQQWKNPNSVPADLPQGTQAIYADMQDKYWNTPSSPDVILGAYTNNQISCYPEKYYGEQRDYAVSPGLSRWGSSIPYTSSYDSSVEIDGLYVSMSLGDILKWAFEHDAPMSLNLQPLYEAGTTAHAVTCWGARYSDLDNSIVSLFYTDSDDTINNDQETERIGLRITNEFGYDSEKGIWWCELDGNLRYQLFNVTLLNPEAFYVIPEPSAFGLLAGAFALALLVARRRRRSGC